MMYSDGGRNRHAPINASASGITAAKPARRAFGPEPQVEARRHRQRRGDSEVGNQQALEAVAMQRAEREHQGDRRGCAEDRRPSRRALPRAARRGDRGPRTAAGT